MKFSFLTNYFNKCLIYISCILTALSSSCANQLHCFMGKVSTIERSPIHRVDCSTPATVRPITACIIFAYQTGPDGAQRDTRLTFGGIGEDHFSCDKNHLCKQNQQNNAWIRNISYAGRKGNLYCCNTSACNEPGLVSMPKTQVPCFVGSTSDAKSRGSVQPCGSSRCYNRTNGNTTEHQCDTEGLCAKHKVTNGCQQITDGTVKKRLCCCSHHSCNRPVSGVEWPWPAAPPAHSLRTKPTMAPMPADLLPATRQDRERKSKVAGIVSATVLGIALIILIVVIAIKQWQRYREKYNFSYMQLTADMMVL